METVVVPLNDLANEKKPPVLTPAGFISLDSPMYVESKKGKITEIAEGVIFAPYKNTRVLLAPKGTVHEVISNGFKNETNPAYALYELIPPGNDRVQLHAKLSRFNRRFTMWSVGLAVSFLVLFYLTFNVAKINSYGSQEVIGPKTYNSILDIMKDKEFIQRRKDYGMDEHTEEFINRIEQLNNEQDVKEKVGK